MSTSNSAISNHSRGFVVKSSGMLTLLQDLGRFGQANLGLTHGGPADKQAFLWANRLLQNSPNATALEVTIGGLKLEALVSTCVCVTGADMNFTINGQTKENWCSYKIQKGDVLQFGFATAGVKAYLAVAGGFCVDEQFGSASTVMREKIGGLCGDALKVDDVLPTAELTDKTTQKTKRYLSEVVQPTYSESITLRVVLGYQQESFARIEQMKFFTADYRVSKQWDRMGYRLEGQPIVSTQSSMLSEGIALGAIQIPPDGQPIILMNDRQTIGGYPKIGSVLSIDLAKLAQCGQGATVRFEQITIDDAHNLLQLDKYRFDHTPIMESEW